jgi:hypothetical protein
MGWLNDSSKVFVVSPDGSKPADDDQSAADSSEAVSQGTTELGERMKNDDSDDGDVSVSTNGSEPETESVSETS